jgi:hypothetical protein
MREAIRSHQAQSTAISPCERSPDAARSLSFVIDTQKAIKGNQGTFTSLSFVIDTQKAIKGNQGTFTSLSFVVETQRQSRAIKAHSPL